MSTNGAEGTARTSLYGLIPSIREDLVANQGHWERAGFHTMVVYRLGRWAIHRRGIAGAIANAAYRLLYGLVRNLYGIELPRGTQVGRRLKLPHPVGLVVTHQAVIGDDCLILQNVTIGLGGHRGRKRAGPHAPTIGDRVEIGAGAVLMGGITVGDDARIGPNAVVLTNVPPGGTAFAPPTKIMKPLRPIAHDEAANTPVDA